MSNKPIVRWTVGKNCTDLGLSLLKESVFKFKDLYLDQFDYWICYNNFNKSRLSAMNVNLLDQSVYIPDLPIAPIGPAWKLYPVRLNINVPEISIDNDLIIYKKLWQIEELLNESVPFFSEAIKRSYGSFDNQISDVKLNSGLIGYPPGLDIHELILKKLLEKKTKWWWSHFEEQGCLASIFDKLKYNLITLEEVNVCEMKDKKRGTHGIHLIGSNGGYDTQGIFGGLLC